MWNWIWMKSKNLFSFSLILYLVHTKINKEFWDLIYLQITPVLLAAVDSPVESLDSAKFCDKSNFFWRRRGNSQQNKNITTDNIMKTMTQPLKIPHQTITGKPRNCFGEPDSMGGHIRAVNVTDHWYKPSLKSFTSSGPIQ